MLKKGIRKILHKFRYDIIRINRLNVKNDKQSLFAPLRHSMEESLRHILTLNFYPSVIVDVGTAEGTFPLMRVFPKSRFLWIEPLIEYENELKKLASKYNGDYIISAAGKTNGKIKLNVHPDLHGSSIFSDLNNSIPNTE